MFDYIRSYSGNFSEDRADTTHDIIWCCAVCNSIYEPAIAIDKFDYKRRSSCFRNHPIGYCLEKNVPTSWAIHN